MDLYLSCTNANLSSSSKGIFEWCMSSFSLQFLHCWALICSNFWANPLVNNNSKTKALSHINLVGLIRNKREKARLVIIIIIIIIIMIVYSTFLQHKLNYKAGVVDMHSQKHLCLLRLPIVSWKISNHTDFVPL